MTLIFLLLDIAVNTTIVISVQTPLRKMTFSIPRCCDVIRLKRLRFTSLMVIPVIRNVSHISTDMHFSHPYPQFILETTWAVILHMDGLKLHCLQFCGWQLCEYLGIKTTYMRKNIFIIRINLGLNCLHDVEI